MNVLDWDINDVFNDHFDTRGASTILAQELTAIDY